MYKVKFDPFLQAIKQERSVMKQEFTATAGQTVFTVTDFALDDDYMIIINDAFQGVGHSRSGNVITLTNSSNDGDSVIIIN